MRFFFAIAGAIMITVSLFLFMQKLIENRQNANSAVPVYEPIEVVHRRHDTHPPEPTPETPSEPEPVLEELSLPTLSPEPAVEMEVPAFDLAMGELELLARPGKWSTPLGADAVSVMNGSGTGAEGYVEVVPIATRFPNVPELAWKNKINGWVLVAFNVLPNGRTHNIRVLDANPRGIFEEKVIAAVEDWMYSVHYFGELKGQIILTQKVEVEWKRFPNNYLNLDR